MIKSKLSIWLLILSLLLCSSAATTANGAEEERIQNFHSDITINKDSSLTVKETIQVTASGLEIRHGIYRDFPTKYKDKNGLTHKVSFRVQGATKNGTNEPYDIEPLSNGQRVYIGDADTLISPGVYTYELSYTTNRQLGFFGDHDELYWNVTGNGWIFPIDKASTTITLPEGIPAEKIKLDGFTGPTGSTDKNFESSTNASGQAFFSTTRQLSSYEGLTIVVGWPKGFVSPPTTQEKILAIFMDNIGTLIVFVGMISVLIFYLIRWNKFGRDPKRGTIVPLYESPENLSPAATRYIAKQMFDNNAFACAIISLATKGYVVIQEKTKKVYTLKKTESLAPLSTEESTLYKNLFESGDTFELIQSNHVEIISMMNNTKNHLKKDHGHLFDRHIPSLVGGIMMSFFFWVVAWIATVNSSLVSIPILILLGIITIIMHIIFAFLLPSRTIEGRKIMDQIEGFKWFLSVTEKDRLNFFNPPEKTPELFEKFLPYALALGVEHKWSEQFTEVFSKLTQNNPSYSPSWYIGVYGTSFNPSTFSSNVVSSFPGVVSSSSAVPGSSSGSGGSSGGGGGGGGGGGW